MRSLRNYFRFLATVQLLPALEGGEETLVGGQAVLEGVMMRSPHAWAIACRKPSGEVVTMREPLERPSERHQWMAWPIIRGIITLGYAMSLGYRNPLGVWGSRRRFARDAGVFKARIGWIDISIFVFLSKGAVYGPPGGWHGALKGSHSLRQVAARSLAVSCMPDARPGQERYCAAWA